MLFSNGNADFYEQKLRDDSLKLILTNLGGNAIVFNYPGVGESSGMPNRAAMAKAYRAVLTLLENQKKGLGAKEIIGYGHSLGGGVQGDALRLHDLKPGIKYCFVKSCTFSDFSTAVAHITGWKALEYLVKFLGWNMSSVESSKNLQVPEIIMQSANVSDYTDIGGQPKKVRHDGLIPAEASLARKLMDNDQPFLGNKYFMGIPEDHYESLCDSSHLVNKITEMLKLQ